MKTLFKQHPVLFVLGAIAGLACTVLGIVALANHFYPPSDYVPETQATKGTALWSTTQTTSQNSTDEATLRALLQNQIDEEDDILAFDYLDYDGDGTKEAFAFAGKATGDEDGGPPYLGDLWFVNDAGAELVVERGEYNGYWEINKTYTFGTREVVVLSKFFQTGSSALVWAVKNGKPYEESGISHRGGTFTRLDGNDFALQHDTYDASFDGTGHTYKWYWFYWDEQTDSFKEYGGREIEYEQFSKCKGAEAVLNAIDEADCAVREIYYRANGIININYVNYEFESNYNVTLQLKGDTVTLQSFADGAASFSTDRLALSNQDGVYAAALTHDIATYPEELPKVFG